MIQTTLKFFLFFSISFVILSIPVDSNTLLFDKFHVLTSPALTVIFSNVQSTYSKIEKRSRHIGKRLFENAQPQIEEKIKGPLSSAISREIPEDDHLPISPEEEQLMLQALDTTDIKDDETF
jgi:hypothetical protein